MKRKKFTVITLVALLLGACYGWWYLRWNYLLSNGTLFFTTNSDGERTAEKVFYTGGNVLDFFQIPDRDSMKITWAHRANNKAELEDALKDSSVLMVEADVRLRPSDGVPVMAHNPVDIALYDQTLDEWLKRVVNVTTKGVKLDIKSTGALEPSLGILRSMEHSLKVPIWINSDVLVGPNSVTIPVNVTVFFDEVGEIFPHSTISPGWTTAYNPFGENMYTQPMVEEMYTHCRWSRQAITFPVRASLTAKSIPQLKWLIRKSNRYSLTVWHSGQEDVPTEDLLQIHNNFTKSQVFYDLPEKMMQDFQNALNQA